MILKFDFVSEFGQAVRTLMFSDLVYGLLVLVHVHFALEPLTANCTLETVVLIVRLDMGITV